MKKICLILTFLISTAWIVKANEGDTITYRSKSILAWTDFRMDPNNNDTSKLSLNLTIVTFTKKVDIWFGIITVESFSGIKRDSSWVKSEYQSDQLLKYAQLKYDIANFYAKKCEKEINRKKINAGFTKKISEVIESYIQEMNLQFKNYDQETDSGNKNEIIDLWRTKLTNGVL
jgi:hypothetical protein